MMHTMVSAPQRLPRHPLSNNFHLIYGSKYIASVLLLHIKIKFKNLHCYLHFFFPLRVAISHQPHVQNDAIQIANLVSHK